jgi:hypothetical protein
MASRSKHKYVDNKKLYEELAKYSVAFKEAKENNKPRPQMSAYLGMAIIKISEGLSMRWNYNGYTYRDEMVGDAIENVVRYVHNFDPVKYKNAFGYITMIINNAFLRKMEAEKEQVYIRHKVLEDHTLQNRLASVGENEENFKITVDLNEDGRLDNLINKFESKKMKKPKKKKGVELFEDEKND